MGLNKGTQVTLAGMDIGYVNEVSLDKAGHITIKFKIKDRYRSIIHKDSQALVKQKNFVVGDWEIELTRGSPSSPQIADGDTMSWDMPFRIDKTIEQITAMVGTVGQLLDQVRSGKGSVGKILMEDSLALLLENIGDNSPATRQAQGTIDKADQLLSMSQRCQRRRPPSYRFGDERYRIGQIRLSRARRTFSRM